MAKFQDTGGQWWYDTAGVMVLLSINNRETISRACKSGELKHVPLCGGKCNIFLESDLLNWNANRKPRGGQRK